MPSDAAIQVFTPSVIDEPFVVVFARNVGVPLVMGALIDKGIIERAPDPTAVKKADA